MPRDCTGGPSWLHEMYSPAVLCGIPYKSMSVHPCTQHYTEALLDPFGPVSGKEVCLPATLLPLPSLKFTTRLVVPWYTGTGGAGYLLFRPGRSWTSGQTCAYATIAGNTVGTSTVTTVTPDANGVAFSSRSPMTMSPAGLNPRVRLVTCGMKTICATPGLNRGGMIAGLVNTNHNSIAGSTLAQVDVFPQVARKGFGTDALDFRLNFGGPVREDELAFSSPTDTSLDTSCMMVFCVTSASSPQNFQTEIICYWEATGDLEGQTASEADPGPAGTAAAVVQSQIMNNKGNSPHSGKWLSETWSMVKSAWKQYAPSSSTVSSMIRTGAQAALQLALRSQPAAAAAAQILPMLSRSSASSARAVLPKK
jgi:hypothetical protein